MKHNMKQLKDLTEDAQKEILWRHYNGEVIEIYWHLTGWQDVADTHKLVPDHIYRGALVKPKIDWSHVAYDFSWLAVDQDEEVFFFTTKPTKSDIDWCCDGNVVNAGAFESYKRGTCNWKDSLIERV